MNIEELRNTLSQVLPDGPNWKEHRLAIDVAAALLAKAHAAGFITDEGKVRKVVGKLEYTEEGSIISRGGSVWIHQQSNDGVLVREWVHSLIGEKAWDTREAAEAARGEK